MITTSVYAFSKCCSFVVASTSSSLSKRFSYPISPFNTIIAIPVQRRPYSLPRFNSSIVVVILLCININLASAAFHLRQVKFFFPTHPPYFYHIIIIVTLRLLRRRDAACGGGVVVDREARRLRSYGPLDEGIHEEAEGKRKLWSE
jgi:hypothetical protein